MKHVEKFKDFGEVNEGVKNTITSGLVALSMLVSSCQSIDPEDKSKIEDKIEELQKQQEDNKYQIITPDNNIQDVNVVVIDSCEYLKWNGYGGSTNMTHKGNCKFCAKNK